MIDVKVFINDYKEAFGSETELPLAFWYSDTSIADTEKINGCFFKALSRVRQGTPISLGLDSITCGGGKFYTGFTEMPERVPNFVSLKERYKQTPEMVIEFIENLQVPRTDKKYLNFSRIDNLDSFDKIEGILFLATPDILSGLTTWAYFDNNDEDGVHSGFGSGCSAIVTQTILENRRNGRRTFIGLFDPSARPYFEENILSYSIPMSRFKEMYQTMRKSCLFDTHAWGEIRERIINRSLQPR